MDKIVLTGMEFFARHGVFDEEATLGARFIVDVELYLDLREVGADLKRTVNYAVVYDLVRREVTETRQRLIEALAGEIAAKLLAFNVRLAEVVVRVHKPHAPLPGVVRDVYAEVRRRREP
jgi:dihydroneopterin aldolase